LIDLYDRLPQTFGHLDACRPNLFSKTKTDRSVETIAIDWANVGISTLSDDLRALVWNTLGLGIVELDQAQEFYDISLNGYLTGLEETGWQGNPDLVRYGAAIAGGLQILLLLDIGMFPSPEEEWNWMQSNGAFFLELMDRAITLRPTLL
jgi:hypothetical protein